MEIIENETLKKIELGILIHIDEICRKNDLKYFLCGGTLLGAVRHKGFIPWDDDIDIAMPRPDYDKFLKLMRNDEKYLALSPLDDGYYYNFAKVVDKSTKLAEIGYRNIYGLGVHVDVFPLEGMPDGNCGNVRHFKRLNSLRIKIASFAYLKPKIRKNLFAYFKSLYIYYVRNKRLKLIDLQKKYDALAKKYDYEKSDYVYATGGAYGERDIFSKKFFENTVQLEFEGLYFSAPAEWDDYLKQLYGNYMELPPTEKRVAHHNFKATYMEE